MFVYVHIPFCNNICKYCDFPKLLYDKKFVNNYLDALEKEIDDRYNKEEVISIFIGGGTPTSLDYLELERLLKIINKFNKDKLKEFTIESNIESLDNEKIILLKKYGINRISLGVQSFDDDILKELNRKHTKEDVFEVVNNIKKNGISNISIDYIYGVDTDIDKVKRDMDVFLELDVPHISCYSLIIEENTVFGINGRNYIDETQEYEMYKYIEEFLGNNGYFHYEISNYGKDGYCSIHNLNYWDNGSYYGFGLGSVSYIDFNRISNTRNINKYINGEYIDSSIYEDEETRLSNSIILGLRKVKGIDVNSFNDKYNTNLIDLYNIKELIIEGKLVLDNGFLRVSDEYFYMQNEILINFI